MTNHRRVIASIEGRVWRDAEGQWFCRAPHANENYWRGVLAEGCDVTLVARRTLQEPHGATPISPSITVHPIDDFGLEAAALHRIPRSVRDLFVLLRGATCAYVRMPGLVGPMVAFVAVLRRVRLVAHLVGNPVEAAPRLDRRWLNFLIRSSFRVSTTVVLRMAEVVFYVDAALADAYPPRALGKDRWGRAFRKRNVDIDALAWADAPRDSFSEPIVLVAAGSQEQNYKGHDLLIKAVSELVERGVDIELRLIGDGRLQPALRTYAQQLGVQDRVHFLGHLPGVKAVQSQLRSCDVFVLPSRTEGFPRALVEAMAAGIPCLATDVGAVSAVLPAELLIRSTDTDAIRAAIERLTSDPLVMKQAARDCLWAAKTFRDEQRTENERFALKLASRGSAT